jgi:hypothetical protein
MYVCIIQVWRHATILEDLLHTPLSKLREIVAPKGGRSIASGSGKGWQGGVEKSGGGGGDVDENVLESVLSPAAQILKSTLCSDCTR